MNFYEVFRFCLNLASGGIRCLVPPCAGLFKHLNLNNLKAQWLHVKSRNKEFERKVQCSRVFFPSILRQQQSPVHVLWGKSTPSEWMLTEAISAMLRIKCIQRKVHVKFTSWLSRYNHLIRNHPSGFPEVTCIFLNYSMPSYKNIGGLFTLIGL